MDRPLSIPLPPGAAGSTAAFREQLRFGSDRSDSPGEAVAPDVCGIKMRSKPLSRLNLQGRREAVRGIFAVDREARRAPLPTG